MAERWEGIICVYKVGVLKVGLSGALKKGFPREPPVLPRTSFLAVSYFPRPVLGKKYHGPSLVSFMQHYFSLFPSSKAGLFVTNRSQAL